MTANVASQSPGKIPIGPDSPYPSLAVNIPGGTATTRAGPTCSWPTARSGSSDNTANPYIVRAPGPRNRGEIIGADDCGFADAMKGPTTTSGPEETPAPGDLVVPGGG